MTNIISLAEYKRIKELEARCPYPKEPYLIEHSKCYWGESVLETWNINYERALSELYKQGLLDKDDVQ